MEEELKHLDMEAIAMEAVCARADVTMAISSSLVHPVTGNPHQHSVHENTEKSNARSVELHYLHLCSCVI